MVVLPILLFLLFLAVATICPWHILQILQRRCDFVG